MQSSKDNELQGYINLLAVESEESIKCEGYFQLQNSSIQFQLNKGIPYLVKLVGANTPTDIQLGYLGWLFYDGGNSVKNIDIFNVTGNSIFGIELGSTGLISVFCAWTGNVLFYEV